MAAQQPGPNAASAADRARAAVATGLLGASLFAVFGALEAGVFALCFDDPQPLAVLRRAVQTAAVAGAGAGLAWGAVSETLVSRPYPVRRRGYQRGALTVLYAVGVLLVHVQRHGLPAGTPVGSTLSIAAAAGPLLAAALLLATLRPCFRCGPEARGAVIARPLRHAAGLALALAIVSALPDDRAHAAPVTGPDVLLVVLDTTRADRFPPHPDHARAPTPSFDALAAEGVVFGGARSASPWTLPSHASMFTGALPSEHGATSEHPHLDGALPTLAERLGAAGLHTVAFARKGWLNRRTGVLRGFRQAFDLLDRAPLPALLEVRRRLSGPDEPEDQGGRWLTELAGRWFLEHADVPRFAFLNYDEAHSPLRPPEPWRSRALGERADTPWGRQRVPHAQRFNTGLETYAPEDFEVFARLYDAEISYQDELLGELLAALERSGRLDDTLVIVTSDHGEHLGEHGLLGHDFSLSETVLRVPLVLRCPGRLPAGLVLDAPVETRRLAPLIDAVGAPDPSRGPLPEAEIVSLLTGPIPGGPAIVSELYRPPFGSAAWAAYPRRPEFDRRLKCVLLGGHKYTWASDGRDALSAPLSDPDESQDLLASRPDLAAELRALLLADPRLWPIEERGPAPELGAELDEHLRQMGYAR
jgi:arylsulfatase A-like enzyme